MGFSFRGDFQNLDLVFGLFVESEDMENMALRLNSFILNEDFEMLSNVVVVAARVSLLLKIEPKF